MLTHDLYPVTLTDITSGQQTVDVISSFVKGIVCQSTSIETVSSTASKGVVAVVVSFVPYLY